MKCFLLTMVFIPLIASGGMSITTNEQVSATLKSDVLQGSLSFEEQSKNANTIKEHFNAILAEVKRADPKGKYCQGGGYQLSPRYSYKDQKQEFIGYSGNLYFGCEFNTVEHYNTLIAGVDKVSAPSVRKTQGALSWGISEKIQASVRQGLQVTLLRTAKMKAETFSKETGLVCEVASVNFGSIPQVVPMMKSMAIRDSVPTESPIQRDEESILEATVNYTCSKSVP